MYGIMGKKMASLSGVGPAVKANGIPKRNPAFIKP